MDQATVPEGAEQIFFMSQNIKDNMKEDLAWGTYVLLRNMNTIPVVCPRLNCSILELNTQIMVYGCPNKKIIFYSLKPKIGYNFAFFVKII